LSEAAAEFLSEVFAEFLPQAAAELAWTVCASGALPRHCKWRRCNKVACSQGCVPGPRALREMLAFSAKGCLKDNNQTFSDIAAFPLAKAAPASRP
jgi:hypothetical protein